MHLEFEEAHRGFEEFEAFEAFEAESVYGSFLHGDPGMLLLAAVLPAALRLELHNTLWGPIATRVERCCLKSDGAAAEAGHKFYLKHLITAALLLPSACAGLILLQPTTPPPTTPPATTLPVAATEPSAPYRPATNVSAMFIAGVLVVVLVLVGSGAGLPRDPSAPGLPITDFTPNTYTSWADGCAEAGLGPVGGALTAAARLCLWHLLQPTVYLTALSIYWPDIGPWSRSLGWWVGVREVGYLLTCLRALWHQPAHLFVDVGATLRLGDDNAGFFVLTYALFPEKFLLGVAGLPRWVGAIALTLIIPLLDLVSIAALVVAIVPAEPFPPVLLAGYSLTALAGVSFLVLLVDTCTCRLTARWSEPLWSGSMKSSGLSVGGHMEMHRRVSGSEF